MRKQFASPQHSIHGVNRKVNAPAVLAIMYKTLQEYQEVAIALRFSLKQGLLKLV